MNRSPQLEIRAKRITYSRMTQSKTAKMWWEHHFREVKTGSTTPSQKTWVLIRHYSISPVQIKVGDHPKIKAFPSFILRFKGTVVNQLWRLSQLRMLCVCVCVFMYTNSHVQRFPFACLCIRGAASIKPADKITPSGDGLSPDRLSLNEISATLLLKQGLQTQTPTSDWLWTNQWFVWTSSKIVNLLTGAARERKMSFSKDIATPIPLLAYGSG